MTNSVSTLTQEPCCVYKVTITDYDPNFKALRNTSILWGWSYPPHGTTDSKNDMHATCPGSYYCPVNTPDPPHQHTIRGNKIGMHTDIHGCTQHQTRLPRASTAHTQTSTAKHCARKRRARLSENPTDPYVSGRFGTCTHHFRHQPRAGATCSSNAVLSRVGSCVSSMRIEQGRG